MRTTLTLDADVAAMLKKAIAKDASSFKDVVNTALRAGLATMLAPEKPKTRFVQRTYDFGPVPSPSEVNQMLLNDEVERFERASRR